jgi:hypothetical protein
MADMVRVVAFGEVIVLGIGRCGCPDPSTRHGRSVLGLVGGLLAVTDWWGVSAPPAQPVGPRPARGGGFEL